MIFPSSTPAAAPRSGARRRHAERRRQEAAQAQVLEATERAFRTFAQGRAASLALFAQARLIGRLQALRTAASELGFVDLTAELGALMTGLLRTLQERRLSTEAKLSRLTRPRLIRPQMHAGVEPRLAAPC